jgi:hypothetical protein
VLSGGSASRRVLGLFVLLRRVELVFPGPGREALEVGGLFGEVEFYQVEDVLVAEGLDADEAFYPDAVGHALVLEDDRGLCGGGGVRAPVRPRFESDDRLVGGVYPETAGEARVGLLDFVGGAEVGARAEVEDDDVAVAEALAAWGGELRVAEEAPDGKRDFA